MDIQTKYREVILNAKCEYVCAVDKLVKKMNYGEDACCCANKLYLASRLINRLECYCFETPVLVETEVLSKFTVTIGNNNMITDGYVVLIVDGVQVYSVAVSIGEYKPTIFATMFDSLGYSYTLASTTSSLFTLTIGCEISTVKVMLTVGKVSISESDFTNTVVGACATSNPPCYNCISNSDLPKMYEVLNKLLQ